MLSEINSIAPFALQFCTKYSSETCLYEINGFEKGDMKNFPINGYSKSDFFFSFRKKTSKRLHEKCFKHCDKYYNNIWTR